ncbi:hypothetical protein GCM10027190_06530 [Spirosoma areae]
MVVRPGSNDRAVVAENNGRMNNGVDSECLYEETLVAINPAVSDNEVTKCINYRVQILWAMVLGLDS